MNIPQSGGFTTPRNEDDGTLKQYEEKVTGTLIKMRNREINAAIKKEESDASIKTEKLPDKSAILEKDLKNETEKSFTSVEAGGEDSFKNLESIQVELGGHAD